MEYDALSIPPHASARFIAHCAVAPDVSAATGAPFGMKVFYELPHYHTLATGFFLHVLGGPHDGESMLEVGGLNGDAHGHALDPPVDVTGADGFQFACQYDNPTSSVVGWGFGNQEMCEVFGWSDSPVFFESRVTSGSPAGTDGDVQLFTGDCTTMILSK
jgi:hypothetical protein